MKIIDIEYFDTFFPQISCGTGYSEPDRFIFHFNDDTPSEYVYIDIWYRTPDTIKEIFVDVLKKNFGNSIENVDEAFELYVKEIVKNGCCPYSFEAIMRYN